MLLAFGGSMPCASAETASARENGARGSGIGGLAGACPGDRRIGPGPVDLKRTQCLAGCIHVRTRERRNREYEIEGILVDIDGTGCRDSTVLRRCLYGGGRQNAVECREARGKPALRAVEPAPTLPHPSTGWQRQPLQEAPRRPGPGALRRPSPPRLCRPSIV